METLTMRKTFPRWLPASLLVTVLCIAFLIYVFTNVAAVPPRVGVFYYPWFGEGLGSTHWNQSSDAATTVVDEPLLGWYDSANATVINQHFAWFEELQVDFAICSWWGPNSHEDNNTKTIFSTIDALGDYTTKLAIMIEPFNDTNFFNGTGEYDYSHMYNYVWNNFANKYPHLYEKRENKPVLFMYNGDNLTDQGKNWKSDARFSYLVVGMAPYTDIVFHHLTDVYNGSIPHGRSYSIAPRYDDSILNRFWSNHTIDFDYSENRYIGQWDEVLNWAKNGKLEYVMLCTWNDYSERTQIEPHHDRDAFTSDPYYLFNITKEYVSKLKE
jgi:hypothetical protein